MIQQPDRDFPIAKPSGVAHDQFQGWIDSVTDLLNLLNFAEGSGSPEGVLYSDKKKLYFNNSGAPGTFIYIKTTSKTLNTGWVAIG